MMGCQQKVIYVTPEIKGQVIDKETNQPIESVKVWITSKDLDITDANGLFYIPAIEYKYRVKAPNYHDIQDLSMSSIEFISDKYITKSYYINNFFSTNKAQTTITSSFEEKRYIDMGKVYLTAKDAEGAKVQEERIDDSIAYCQPHQSQKTTECIPLPATLSHTQEPHIE